MKILSRHILLSFLLVMATAAYAAVPTMDVTVSDAKGKLAFKGKTSAKGTFSTGKLAPGQYTVQFNAKKGADDNGSYALVVSAGKKKVSAADVAGSKLAAGGVAMKVEVGNGLNISGQVAAGGGDAVTEGNSKVKIVKGKRYVWVTGGMGSNMGGRWVEEGSVSASNVTGVSNSSVHAIQEHNDWKGQGGN
jgi:hypothetical protein